MANALTDVSNVSTDEYDHPKGGVLRPEELKALLESVNWNYGAFGKLGDQPGSINEASRTGTINGASQSGHTTGAVYTPDEASTLASLTEQRQDLHTRRDMFLDRDKLISMVAARSKATLAALKQKDKSLKDICGYDARLAWNDHEFNEWRLSEQGQAVLKAMALPPPEDKPASANEGVKEKEGDEAEVGPGVCKKKRCQRHLQWYKVQQQDNAMEKDEIRQTLRKLDAEEKDLKDRAMIRTLEGLQV